MDKIRKVIGYLSENPPGLLAWIAAFSGIIALRLFLDNFMPQKGLFSLTTPTDVHNFLFFLLNLLFLWLLLSWLIQENPFKLSKIMLWAASLFIFPPVLDMLKTGGSIFWSPYLFNSLSGLGGQFWSFFGQLPTGMVYFGTRIIAAVSVLLLALFVFAKTKSFWRALAGALGTYTVLFFMASLPSWATLAYYFFQGSKKISEVSGIDAVQLFSAPKLIFGIEPAGGIAQALAYNLNLIYFLMLIGLLLALFFFGNKNKLRALLGNARLPQIIVHGGLFFAGLGIGFWVYPDNLNLNVFSAAAALDLLAAIMLAWLASVVINDIYDFSIDAVSNSTRPLQQKIFEPDEYRQLGIAIFLLSLLGGLVVDPKFAALLLIYQFLAWVYSGGPFRLKKFPLVATFLSSAALLIILFIGFTLVSGDNNLAGLSWRIILLLLIAFTLVLPLKDFKDIEGDRRHGIWTVPVIFGEEKGRLINAIGIFIPFVLSVFFLNELRLFWWAVLFGIIAFLIIVNKKINPRRIFWWVLGVAAVYGLILVKIVFL